VVSVPPEVVPADVCGLGGVVETGVVVNELEGTVEAGVVVVTEEGGVVETGVVVVDEEGGVVETGVVVNELEGTVEAGVVVVSDLDEGGIYPELDAALFLLPLVPGALYVALKLPAGLVFAPGGL